MAARSGAKIGDAWLTLDVGGDSFKDGADVSPRGVSPVATVILRDRSTLAGLVRDPEMSFGDGYMDGSIEVEGDFVRFLEDWQKNSNTFTYYGSMVELFNSQQATGHWSASANIAKLPSQHWYYDTGYQDSSPPGKLTIAAYLQQQRWYQVY